MDNDEFVLGLRGLSGALGDLLSEAEGCRYMYHDKKVFKLLSKAYLAVELATLIKVRGDEEDACGEEVTPWPHTL